MGATGEIGVHAAGRLGGVVVPGGGMSIAKPVGFRAVMLTGILLAAILCLLATPAVARGVHAPHATYTLPVRDGVGSFTVRLADRNPPVPPLVLYDAHPANLDCSATYFDYRVSQ